MTPTRLGPHSCTATVIATLAVGAWLAPSTLGQYRAGMADDAPKGSGNRSFGSPSSPATGNPYLDSFNSTQRSIQENLNNATRELQRQFDEERRERQEAERQRREQEAAERRREEFEARQEARRRAEQREAEMRERQAQEAQRRAREQQLERAEEQRRQQQQRFQPTPTPPVPQEPRVVWDPQRQEYRTRDGSPLPMITYRKPDGTVDYSGIPIEAIDPTSQVDVQYRNGPPNRTPPSTPPPQPEIQPIEFAGLAKFISFPGPAPKASTTPASNGSSQFPAGYLSEVADHFFGHGPRPEPPPTQVVLPGSGHTQIHQTDNGQWVTSAPSPQPSGSPGSGSPISIPDADMVKGALNPLPYAEKYITKPLDDLSRLLENVK